MLPLSWADASDVAPTAVNAMVADPVRATAYGQAGRQRCIDEFSWARIAEQTLEIYRKVAG